MGRFDCINVKFGWSYFALDIFLGQLGMTYICINTCTCIGRLIACVISVLNKPFKEIWLSEISLLQEHLHFTQKLKCI